MLVALAPDHTIAYAFSTFTNCLSYQTLKLTSTMVRTAHF